MKKQIKKLNLSKRTISNLEASEMNKQIGGTIGTVGNTCYTCKCPTWGKGKTCYGHKTC